ncbi:MAG: hypothetical protein AVDCRST_MAG71-1727, partial [uncultured Lysobacter sp.]
CACYGAACWPCCWAAWRLQRLQCRPAGKRRSNWSRRCASRTAKSNSPRRRRACGLATGSGSSPRPMRGACSRT